MAVDRGDPERVASLYLKSDQQSSGLFESRYHGPGGFSVDSLRDLADDVPDVAF